VRPDPAAASRRDRALLAAWLVAAFAASAAREPATLAAASLLALAVLPRGAPAALRKLGRSVAPLTLALCAASAAWTRVAAGAWPPAAPFVALVLRACLVAFLGFQVLARVNLPRAFAPWPAASRLLAVTLAQIHALRLLATESALGLRSRLVRKPRARDVVRGAGAVTATLLTLSLRNARDVTDAMRSRGF
jgi:cobalt/nickel transport system permease protein